MSSTSRDSSTTAIKDTASSTVTRQVLDTTLPTNSVERTLEYHAHFTLQYYETDCATVRPKVNEQNMMPFS
jgi:hypothetical protein